MAQRRMFSFQVVETDQFLDMPLSSQTLYFHLGMYADDDGFITPKKIMRILGSTQDDLNVLIAKNFLIPFENGVFVITHWNENNYIQNDRYKPTQYTFEKSKLICIQNVYTMDTQDRLGKDRLGKDRLLINTGSEKKEKIKPDQRNPEIQELWEYGLTHGFNNTKQHINRFAIKRLLKEHAVDQLKKALDFSQTILEEPYAPKVHNWLDLEDKYLKLRDFVQRHNKKINEAKEKHFIL